MTEERLKAIIAIGLNKKLSYKFRHDIFWRVFIEFYPYKHDWKMFHCYDPNPNEIEKFRPCCVNCFNPDMLFQAVCDNCKDWTGLRNKLNLAGQLNSLLFNYLGAIYNANYHPGEKT